MSGTPAPRAIVTDIEGTTSDIRFVQEVLFPYARQRLPEFIGTQGQRPDVRHWLDAAAREGHLVDATPQAVTALLLRWIGEDRKSTALKALQGMVWKDGYEAGDFRAHVYADVAPALRAWRERGIALYVYSSGSIQAQKLFFAHSEAGDLTPLFAGYFDTETGAKREATSYARIAAAIGRPPAEILFLSDVEAELDAARIAGMDTVQLCRPPSHCAAQPVHRCTESFSAILP